MTKAHKTFDDLNNKVKADTGSALFDQNSRAYEVGLLIFSALKCKSLKTRNLTTASGLPWQKVIDIRLDLRYTGLIDPTWKSLLLSDWHDPELGWMNMLLDIMTGARDVIRKSTEEQKM